MRLRESVHVPRAVAEHRVYLENSAGSRRGPRGSIRTLATISSRWCSSKLQVRLRRDRAAQPHRRSAGARAPSRTRRHHAARLEECLHRLGRRRLERARRPDLNGAARACPGQSRRPALRWKLLAASRSARRYTMAWYRAILAHAPMDLKKIYLAKLISGEWTGTMPLTEPQAGSTSGDVRTDAARRRRATASISSRAARSSSPTAITISPTTSRSISCSPACPRRRPAPGTKEFLAVPGAEVPDQRRRLARRAQ